MAEKTPFNRLENVTLESSTTPTTTDTTEPYDGSTDTTPEPGVYVYISNVVKPVTIGYSKLSGEFITTTIHPKEVKQLVVANKESIELIHPHNALLKWVSPDTLEVVDVILPRT